MPGFSSECRGHIHTRARGLWTGRLGLLRDLSQEPRQAALPRAHPPLKAGRRQASAEWLLCSGDPSGKAATLKPE